MLVHEHVLVDFVGADQIRSGRYDRNEVSRIALPKLEEVKRLGCGRLLECTPNFLGRDPELLARLSDAAGVEIGRTPACTAPEIMNSSLRLRGAKRPRSSRKGG